MAGFAVDYRKDWKNNLLRSNILRNRGLTGTNEIRLKRIHVSTSKIVRDFRDFGRASRVRVGSYVESVRERERERDRAHALRGAASTT